MDDKKITNTIIERIKYFLAAVENGKYEPQGYEFTVKLNYCGKIITIEDSSIR